MNTEQLIEVTIVENPPDYAYIEFANGATIWAKDLKELQECCKDAGLTFQLDDVKTQQDINKKWYATND